MIPTEPCHCGGLAGCSICHGTGKIENDRRECPYEEFRKLISQSIELMSQDQATYFLATIRRTRRGRDEAVMMLERTNAAVKALAMNVAKLIAENHDYRVTIHRLERKASQDAMIIAKWKAFAEAVDESALKMKSN